MPRFALGILLGISIAALCSAQNGTTFSVSPTSLTFTVTAGGAAPANQNVTISSSLGLLTWSASESTGSVTFSPSEGSVSAGRPITVGVGLPGAGNLAVGVYQYTGVFSYACNNAAADTCQHTNLAITLNVVAANLPPVSPLSLNFSAPSGRVPPPQVLMINSNSGTISWGVTTALTSNAPANWISVAPVSGSASPGSPGQTTVSISPVVLGFPPGTYTANVVVSTSSGVFPFFGEASTRQAQAAGSLTEVTATLTVPGLLLTPSLMTFAALANAPGPSQTLVVSPIGAGSLQFTTSVSASWLSVLPQSATAPTSLTVSVQPSGWAAGTYTGFISLLASGSANPQMVPVTLVVEAAPDGTTTFNYTIAGASPAAQALLSPGCTLPCPAQVVASMGSDQGDWLSVSPTSASITTSGTTFTLSARPGSLPAGQYHGTMALTDLGGDIIYANLATLNITGGANTYSYYFSDLAFAGGFQTTLTLINDSPQSVTCSTIFYSDSGGLLMVPFSQGSISARTDVLPAGNSIHDQTIASLTAPVAEGWAQSTCTGPIQASLLYRYYTNGVATSEAGVNAETAPTSSFVTFAQTATGVAYANPSTTQSATITFTVFSNAGVQLGTKSITLGPLAHGASNLGPLLGLSSFTGMVEITSTIPIISLSLNAEAFPVISSLPPGDLPLGFVGGTGAANYYFSDLAFAGGFQTTLTLINYSPQAVTCTTNFYSDTGTPLLVPFNQGSISTRTDVLPPGGSIHDQTIASLTATVAQGWAQSSCTGPIQASLLYRFYTSGVPTSEAGVNAETAPTTKFVTFAQTATGVAYANPSATQSATVTFSVISNAGARLGMMSITLAPLAHGAANLGPLLSLQNFTGSVEITSTIPIISLSLNAEAFPVISSLPPGDLPAATALY